MPRPPRIALWPRFWPLSHRPGGQTHQGGQCFAVPMAQFGEMGYQDGSGQWSHTRHGAVQRGALGQGRVTLQRFLVLLLQLRNLLIQPGDVALGRTAADSAPKSCVARERESPAHCSRRGRTALSDSPGIPAGAGHAGPSADRCPGWCGSLQPRQRYSAGQTHRLGWTRPSSRRSVHGGADGQPPQPSHPGLLPTPAGGG